jgi:hypothetical protein
MSVQAEAERLLAATTPEPWQQIRYDHGGGRMYQAVPRADARYPGEERRSLIIDAYQQGDREFYFNATRLVRSLLAEIDRVTRALGEVQQDRDAQFAHNATLLERMQELERDNEMYGEYLGRLETLESGRTGCVVWDLHLRLKARLAAAAAAVQTSAHAPATEAGAPPPAEGR